MYETLDVDEVAGALKVSISLLVRRMRQLTDDTALTIPEMAALARLDRGGPATSSALAKQEQISPQAMGMTLAGLESRGLVERRADPDDGRRVVMSMTDTGRRRLWDRRAARTQQLAKAMAAGFTRAELATLAAAAPLIERLAGAL
jgi:DNA-binding MarR family transcriptional regulator